ncbi:MAG: rhamnose isomerase, partial [Candidatus Hydrogenedentota bacterium]
NGDVVQAEEILKEAYQTDVRPLLAQVRMEMGVDPDPIIAFRKSGYSEKVVRERQGEGAATLGG